MLLAEPIAVALLIGECLDRLEIPWLVGGSVASSLHGIPRATQDVDLVADLRRAHIRPLVEALEAFLVPVREKAAHYAAQSGLVDEIIVQGTQRMREEGAETMRTVRKAMGLSSTYNRIARKAEERAKKQAADARKAPAATAEVAR